VRIARAGSRLTVELLSGGRRIGRLAKTTRPGLLRFAIGLDRRSRGRLARARVLRVTVRVTVTEVGGAPQRATRRVTLRATG
jgi:hypothetical protein